MEASNSLKKRKVFDYMLFKRLFSYMKKRWGLLCLTIIFMLSMDIFSSLHPYLTKVGIDESIMSGDIRGLQWTAFFLISCLVIAFVSDVLFNYTVQYMGEQLIYSLRMDVLRKLLFLPKVYFDRTPIGKNLTYLTNDVEAIKKFISEGVVSIMGDLLKVVFIFIFMLYISPLLTAFFVITIPMFVLGTVFFRGAIRHGYRGVRAASSGMNTILVEAITGVKEIRLFNHKQKSVGDFDRANKGYCRSYLSIVRAYSFYFPLIEVVSSIAMLGVLLGAHYFFKWSVQVGDIFAFFIYINMFFRPLRDFAEQFNTFQSAMSGAERIFKFLDEPVVKLLNDRSGKKLLEEHGDGVINEPLQRLRHGIEFRGVHFAYEPDKPVLKNLSFTIRPGEKVALVGSTGSGKTTITALLNRLYEIEKGGIFLDGRSIMDFSYRALRESISIIPQDIFLFTGSLIENITLNKLKHLSAAEQFSLVEGALNKALLAKFSRRLKEKGASDFLEEGKTISGGERQLFALARVFLQDAPIVILDEATANIDSESEKMIEIATQNLLRGKTAIIIAHRLSTIQRVDRILVLQEGILVEEGSHQDLLRKKGVYEKLYSLQSMQMG